MQPSTSSSSPGANITPLSRNTSKVRHKQQQQQQLSTIGTTPPDLLPLADDNNNYNIATTIDKNDVVSYQAGGGYVSRPEFNQQQHLNATHYNATHTPSPYEKKAALLYPSDVSQMSRAASTRDPLGDTDFLANTKTQLREVAFEKTNVNTPTAVRNNSDQLVYAANQSTRPNRAAMIEHASGPGFIFNTLPASSDPNTAGSGGGGGGRNSVPYVSDHLSSPLSSSFHHIADLDRFFVRAYRYHQRGGFWCLTVQELLEIVQFIFVIGFSVFLLRCVNYPVLFRDKPPPSWWYYPTYMPPPSPAPNSTTDRPTPITPSNRTTDKLRISDAVLPASECLSGLPFLLVLVLIVAAVYLLFRLARFCTHWVAHTQMQMFYKHALNIKSDADLQDFTWYEILQKILHAQRHHQMSVHKSELTELDVYQRILRVENYMVALLNKAVVPAEITLPILPLSFMYMPRLYELNLELLLFRGYSAPFENRCSLREPYKQYNERVALIQRMRDRIMWMAVGNLLLSPVLFIWQCLYVMFNYGELLKRDPAVLGSRTWSSYGKWYVRHFNELEHELRARLNRAYAPANEYMSIFVNPLVTTVAHNLVFFAGSILIVLVALTVWDEDVITVEHLITLITGLGIIVAIGRAMLPNENLIWNPQQLMTTILAQIHYMPDGWTSQAHKTAVRDQVANLFQFKLVFLLQELWSPFLTPFMLFFSLRKRAPAIVDFLREYTEEVIGVGDVCAFALMDVRRHGRREWMPDGENLVASREDMHSVGGAARASTTTPPTVRELEREIYNTAEPRAGGGVEPLAAVDEDDILLESASAAAAGKTNFGKTELSLIHFKLLNPKWRPTAKHNQRYLDVVLRKCLQSPGDAFDQAPPLRLRTLAQTYNDNTRSMLLNPYSNPMLSMYAAGLQQQQQDVSLHEQIRQHINNTNNAEARNKGQLSGFEGAPAHELARYISGGGVGSSSEHSNTSSSGMSEASSSAAAAAAAAAQQQRNLNGSSTFNTSGMEPLLRSFISGYGGGGGGLPLDLTAHAMSTSILQVHGAHLRRTQSNHRRRVAENVRSGDGAQTAFSNSRYSSPATGGNDNNDDILMTKASLSVIPAATSEDSNNDASSSRHQRHTSGALLLDFSTTATAGSVHPGAWAASVQRWFPMRIIAGSPTPLRQNARGNKNNNAVSERAPLVAASESSEQQVGAAASGRRRPPTTPAAGGGGGFGLDEDNLA